MRRCRLSANEAAFRAADRVLNTVLHSENMEVRRVVAEALGVYPKSLAVRFASLLHAATLEPSDAPLHSHAREA